MTVYTSSGEDLARYPGQDTLLFYSANDEWKKLFSVKPPCVFFSSSNIPLGAIPCALMLKRQELSQFLIGNDELAVTQLECKNLHLFLLLQKCLGKYYSMYRHK